MAHNAYKALSRVFSVVLPAAGAGLIAGGRFAHRYVADQLAGQRITMPGGKDLPTDEMKSALARYAGLPMTTGPQAEAYANHYIGAHLAAAAKGRTYEEISQEYIAASADPERRDAQETADLGRLKEMLFTGSSLRGMLLNAYGWWLVGSIATWAGVGATGLGAVLAVPGWARRRGHGA